MKLLGMVLLQFFIQLKMLKLSVKRVMLIRYSDYYPTPYQILYCLI